MTYIVQCYWRPSGAEQKRSEKPEESCYAHRNFCTWKPWWWAWSSFLFWGPSASSDSPLSSFSYYSGNCEFCEGDSIMSSSPTTAARRTPPTVFFLSGRDGGQKAVVYCTTLINLIGRQKMSQDGYPLAARFVSSPAEVGGTSYLSNNWFLKHNYFDTYFKWYINMQLEYKNNVLLLRS